MGVLDSCKIIGHRPRRVLTLNYFDDNILYMILVIYGPSTQRTATVSSRAERGQSRPGSTKHAREAAPNVAFFKNVYESFYPMGFMYCPRVFFTVHQTCIECVL